MKLFEKFKTSKTKEDRIVANWQKARIAYEKAHREGGPLLNIFPLYFKYKAILTYLLCLGTRDNGKTFAALTIALWRYVIEKKGRIAYVRRWEDEFRVPFRHTLFNGLVATGYISDLTDGEWTDVRYRGKNWYFCREDIETDKEGNECAKLVVADEPFMTIMDLNTSSKQKSMSRGIFGTILFEEFVAKVESGYIGRGESECATEWANLISTIVGSSGDVLIIMCGNTDNPYCPYFSFMGLKGLFGKDGIKDGETRLYEYASNPDLHVLVTMSANGGCSKPSDKYFAFDNPKLKAITGEALWTLEVYPHIDGPRPYDKTIFKFYIYHADACIVGDVMSINGNRFILFRAPDSYDKIDELDESRELIYADEPDPRRNWRTDFRFPRTPAEQKICELLRGKKMFFETNEIGCLFDDFNRE